MHSPNFPKVIDQLRRNYQGLLALKPNDVMQFKAQFEGLSPAGRQFIETQMAFWQLQVNVSILEELKGIADILDGGEVGPGTETPGQGFFGGEGFQDGQIDEEFGAVPPEMTETRDREAERLAATQAAAAIMGASSATEAMRDQSTPNQERSKAPATSGASSTATSSPGATTVSPPLQGDLMLTNLLGH